MIKRILPILSLNTYNSLALLPLPCCLLLVVLVAVGGRGDGTVMVSIH